MAELGVLIIGRGAQGKQKTLKFNHSAEAKPSYLNSNRKKFYQAFGKC